MSQNGSTIYSTIMSSLEVNANTGGAGIEITRPSVGFKYVDCNFSLCSANGNKAGALYFLFVGEKSIEFTLDGCIFNDTSTNNGAGGAVQLSFDKDKEGFVFTVSGCQFISSEAGGLGGVLAIPTSRAGANSKVTVSQSTFVTSSAVAGGAISIEMPVVSFDVSNCVFSNGKASGGEGGFIKISTCSQEMSIEDTIFTGGTATEGGCIYLESQTQGTFSVNNVTVDTCGSSKGGHSVVVMATNTLLHGLTLKNMPAGYGKLQLSKSGFSENSMLLSACTFEVFGTKSLFDFTSTARIRVELVSCTLRDCSASGNLCDLENGNIIEVSFVNCTFCKVRCNWALVVCRKQSDTFVVEGCHFEDVVVNNDKQQHEAMFDVQGFTSLSFSNNTFQSCKLKNGILRTGKGPSKTSFQSLLFKDCQINHEGSLDKYGFLHVTDSVVDSFEDCHFISCTDDQFSLVSLANPPECIRNCLFEACSCPANKYVLTVTSTSDVHLEGCYFSSMTLPSFALVTTGSSKVVDTSFIDLTCTEHIMKSSTIDFVNVRVEGCTSAGFVSSSVSIHTGKFTRNHIGNALFSVSSAPTSSILELIDCTFNNCDGSSGCILSFTGDDSCLVNITNSDFTSCSCTSTSLHLIDMETSKFYLSGCSFDRCSCSSGSLISLRTPASLFLGSSCFQGTPSKQGVAAYIHSTAPDCDSALPLCFDHDESLSVYFNGEHPLSNYSDEYHVFKCTDCDSIREITSEFTASNIFTASHSFTPSATFTIASNNASNGLSAGAIAGIVIAVVILIAGLVLLILFVVWRRRTQMETSESPGSEMTHETDATPATASVTSFPEPSTDDRPMFTVDALDAFSSSAFEETWG